MKAIGLRCSFAAMIMLAAIPGWAQSAATAPAKMLKTDHTLMPEYFVRGLCAAVHSLSFDDQGGLLVGCLGDTPAEMHKPGVRKIYRITPDAKATRIAEVDCTYVTSVASAHDHLYVACEGPVKILRIAKDGTQTQLAMDGTYNLALNDDGAVYYATAEKTAKIAPDGTVSSVFAASGTWHPKHKVIYRTVYGEGAVFRRTAEPGKPLGKEETIAELPFVKGVTIGDDGTAWVYGFDGADYVVAIRDGRIVKRLRLENVIAANPARHPEHFLNTIAFGKGAFGAKTLYIATWHGDILRINP